MSKKGYFMTDKTFASFAEKYPNVKKNDVKALLAQELFKTTINRLQHSEIENLKNKALGVMGTDQEMNFSDIEKKMLVHQGSITVPH
jgi:hypothetical protein